MKYLRTCAQFAACAALGAIFVLLVFGIPVMSNAKDHAITGTTLSVAGG